jgi:hypothetical protein
VSLGKARRTLLAAGAALAAFSAPALAQAPANFDVEQVGETTRIRIVLPETEGGDLTAEAEIAAGAVMIARLSDAIDADISVLTDQASGYVAMARLDPDGRTLRLALNQTLEPRVSISHNIIAIDLAPAGAAPLPDVVSPYEQAQRAAAEARAAAQAAAAAAAAANAVLPPLPATVRVGEAAEYTRIAFQWPEAVTYALEQGDGRAVLRFSRQADIDLTSLRADPPRFIEVVTPLEEEDGLALAFALAGDVEARVWSDEPGRVVLDVAPANGGGVDAVLAALGDYAASQAQTATADDAASEAADASEAAPEPVEIERPDPTPESGVVPVQVRVDGSDLALTFPWANLPGAAVFRRGDALWIVFDAAAQLNADEIAAAGSRHVRGYRVVSGSDFSALRIAAPGSTQADVRAAGASWTVILSESLDEPPRAVRLARETSFRRPALLRFGLNGARSAVRVPDPVVGDSYLVLTAEGEKRGVITPRRFAETQLLTSAHGVALLPFVDDLEMTVVAGGAELSRPGGMALSRAADPALAASLDRPVTAGFLDLERWRGGEDYRAARDRIEQAAASLEPEAILAYARFQIAWELAHEALTLTSLAAAERPALANTPEVAALRGAANYMAGRYQDAEEDFAHPALQNDPAAQPWRGLIAAQYGDWPEARRFFDAGEETVFFFDPVWRARISAWQALTALRTNDLGSVDALLLAAQAAPEDPEADAIAAFAAAGALAARGDIDGALAAYEALGGHEWTPIQARALLEKLRLEVAEDRVDLDEAVDALEGLRYRWRGDDVEVASAAMLGQVYAEAGRFSEALNTMAQTRTRFPDSPVTRRIGGDMQTLFRELFLEGRADRMDPLDALSLWYEHQDLTPMGPDGLRMARRIAGRLIEIDLLEPAAELLSHQVFERRVTMTNLARAQIASDLARIQLLDNRPEEALRAIETTRVARLPEELVDERRLLQARALSDLGRTDHALELIANDRGPEVEQLRARIAWDARDWGDAGRRAEALLGDRWRDDAELSDQEAHNVLRALIAYALANNSGAMARVESRYGPAMARTRHASAFSMVAGRSAGLGDARLSALVAELGALDRADALMAGFREEDDPAS